MDENEVVLDMAEVRDFFRSKTCEVELMALAEPVLAYAKEIAPVGDPAIDDESGDYKHSLSLKPHYEAGRVVIRLQSDNYKAHWVEDGSIHNKKHATLRTAMEKVFGGLAVPE